jgi:gamma-glutamyltranspeptidase/glutathione hydrolase
MNAISVFGEKAHHRAGRLVSVIPWAIAALPGLLTAAQAEELGWQAKGANGVVVAGRTGSADAGLAVLTQGGNAADAAAAAILALAVTDHNEFCFGSEVPILIYDARRGVVEVISGMGAAPQLATRDYFDKAGGIRRNTAAAAAVPAAPDAIITLLERYGTMRFSEVAAPALRLLDQREQDWHADLARALRRLIAAENADPDRRRGLRLAADYLYRGPLAREIDAWSRANNGLIRFHDLATHTSRIEEPVQADYRGYTICKCNTWTQGPYLLQALKLLEGFDLAKMGFQEPATIHVIVEAMKLALADRDVYYGDPLFVEVPLRELLSDEYTTMRRKLIDMQQASMAQRPGDPRSSKALLGGIPTRFGLSGKANDTTTCLAADRWGNVVAATPSGWSGVPAGHTGVWLGSRLISFNTWPGHPNCIEPGKRPRITLTPSLVLKKGRPVMAVSVAGGDTQDQATLQMISNHIDFGRPADVLVTTPRYATSHLTGSFNQTPPALGELMVSPQMDLKTVASLRSLGHIIKLQTPGSWRIAICLDPQTGVMHGAGDPAVGRHAGAF